MKLVAWQNMLSPHQAPLLEALANRPQVESMTLIVEQELSASRAQLGWQVPDLSSVTVVVAPDEQQLNQLLPQFDGAQHLVSGFAQGRYGKWIRRNLPSFYLYTELAKSDSLWRRTLNTLRYRYFYARMRAQVNGIFAIGARCPQWLTKTVGVESEKIIPFGYFLNANQTFSLEASGATKQAMFVGRLEPVKGIRLFIQQLIEQVNDRQWPLIVLGDGTDRATLEKQTLSIDTVTLKGAVSQESVLGMLQTASLLVLPNQQEEGWGFVVNEALMNGTPVFCTDLTGAQQMVSNAPYCRVFAHSQLDEMIGAVDEFMQRPFSASQRKQLIDWYNRAASVEQACDYLLKHIHSVDLAKQSVSREQYGWL